MTLISLQIGMIKHDNDMSDVSTKMKCKNGERVDGMVRKDGLKNKF
jgi:hypothetical protein